MRIAKVKNMTEEEFEGLLADILHSSEEDLRVSTFQDELLLTTDRGLVVRHGSVEFQLTIVRSR